MKKLFIIPFFSLLMLACGPGKKEAIATNDEMVNAMGKCSKAEKSFFETCSTYNPAAISASLQELASTCQAVKKELEAKQVHKDLSGMKEAALHLVSTYIALEGDYKEYARLYSIQNDDYTLEDEKQTEKVSRSINEKINAEYDAYATVQRNYGKKYGYSLTK